MVTALLCVGSFIVQVVTEKRAMWAAETLQTELGRELVSLEVARNTAGVHLKRVRLHTVECARPLQASVTGLWLGTLHLGMAMALNWGIPVFGFSSSLWAEVVITPPIEMHTTQVSSVKLIRRPE